MREGDQEILRHSGDPLSPRPRPGLRRTAIPDDTHAGINPAIQRLIPTQPTEMNTLATAKYTPPGKTAVVGTSQDSTKQTSRAS